MFDFEIRRKKRERINFIYCQVLLACCPSITRSSSWKSPQAEFLCFTVLRAVCPCFSFITDTLLRDTRQLEQCATCVPTTEALHLHSTFPPALILIILITESAASGWNELLSSPSCQRPFRATQFPPAVMPRCLGTERMEEISTLSSKYAILMSSSSVRWIQLANQGVAKIALWTASLGLAVDKSQLLCL